MQSPINMYENPNARLHSNTTVTFYSFVLENIYHKDVLPNIDVMKLHKYNFMFVYSSESRMRKHAASSSKDIKTGQEKREHKNRRNEWRITKMVLAIFLSFLLCYLPITIVKVVDDQVERPGMMINVINHD